MLFESTDDWSKYVLGQFSHPVKTPKCEKPVPDMTYNVFGGTLNLNQSINQSVKFGLTFLTQVAIVSKHVKAKPN